MNRETELEIEAMREALRREIAIADEQIRQGKIAPFDPYATLERVRQEKKIQGSESCDSLV